MLGMLSTKGKAIIPSDINRSMYSMERYKELLIAPFGISDKCCNVMKKAPAHNYTKETGRVAITAQMATESRLRTQKWLQNGCNAFESKHPISNPMSFWTEQDVLAYIAENHLPICSVYKDVVIDYKAMGQLEGQMSLGDLDSSKFGIFDKERPIYKTTGCSRTGCVLCGFGCHLEKEEDARFLLLKESHPKMYGMLDTIQNNGVTYREAIEWTNKNIGTNIRC